VVLRYNSLCFAQRGKPPLDLKVFISGKAFYNSAFFYKQLEVTRFVFALIGTSSTRIVKSIRPVGSQSCFTTPWGLVWGLRLFQPSMCRTTYGKPKIVAIATTIKANVIRSASAIVSVLSDSLTRKDNLGTVGLKRHFCGDGTD
jgi:hypothetical protein